MVAITGGSCNPSSSRDDRHHQTVDDLFAMATGTLKVPGRSGITGLPARSRRGKVRGHGSGARIAAEALRMDFALSESQQAWHDAAVRFAQDELADDVLGRDARGEFWREGWRRCARLGIQGL